MKERQSKSTDQSERWLEQAEADFDAAQDSLKSNHFEWSCFQAQQAAEKALKAFLFSQGLRAIITHSITELLLEAQKYASVDIAVGQAKTLDSYYIPTRYPNGLPGRNIPARYYLKEDADLCISCAELILKSVKKYMKS
ncbi:MAG: HEPN domain-containing protein [Candidatus Methanofastidiosia archaeon]